MTLRQATSENAELVYQIKHEAYAVYAIQSRGFWDENFQRRYTAENLPDTQLILIEEQVAGWMAVRNESDALEILDIHILPSFQNQGLGTTAISSVIAQAGSARKQVKLSVLKINRSRALYERLGFKEVGATESHWLMEYP